MRILGIDPGLVTTGFGLVELSGRGVKILEAGTIKPDPKAAFDVRLGKIHHHISNILKDQKPDAVVLEKLYAHHKHPITASILGHVRGVITLAVYQQGVVIHEQSPKRIRKALMGNGNATKIQVQSFVKRVLKVPQMDMALDTSDALALALGQAHMMRYKIL